MNDDWDALFLAFSQDGTAFSPEGIDMGDIEIIFWVKGIFDALAFKSSDLMA